MFMSFTELSTLLARHEQTHLLKYWDDLSHEQQQSLARQIDSIPWDELEQLGHISEKKERRGAVSYSPPPAVRLDEIDEEVAAPAGDALLRENKVALLVVAGGQGTRLGFQEPKGFFPIGPLSKKSLFQLLLEKVVAYQRLYKSKIPVYIMTSPATDEATRHYFNQEQSWPLNELSVEIFCQGVMPATDLKSGKLLLSEKGRIAVSPDGHGGLLPAFSKSQLLEKAVRSGIEHFFYAQIDNPLAPLVDPLLLGIHALKEAQLSTLAVSKVSPDERVGHIVEVDGTTQIIEYSDCPTVITEERDGTGRLKFWAGNTAIHIFKADFLKGIAANRTDLPFHRAKKKVPYLDDQGTLIDPPEPNAIKYERFIFDLLPLAKKNLVVEVQRESAFAPVKNGPSETTDTAKTSQDLMNQLYQRWLVECGGTISKGSVVEISPLVAPSFRALKKGKSIVGQNFSGSVYLDEESL